MPPATAPPELSSELNGNLKKHIEPCAQSQPSVSGTLLKLDAAKQQECMRTVTSLVQLPPRSAAAQVSAEMLPHEGEWQVCLERMLHRAAAHDALHVFRCFRATRRLGDR